MLDGPLRDLLGGDRTDLARYLVLAHHGKLRRPGPRPRRHRRQRSLRAQRDDEARSARPADIPASLPARAHRGPGPVPARGRAVLDSYRARACATGTGRSSWPTWRPSCASRTGGPAPGGGAAERHGHPAAARLRPEPLASYLAGLGLIRVIGEQADPAATAAWTPDGLAITTTVADIAAWLAGQYVPTPVLSPWNNGSGFGAKDKEPLRALEQNAGTPPPRGLAEGRDPAGSGGRRQGTRAGLDCEGHGGGQEPGQSGIPQPLPGRVLPWIDAAVVLAGETTIFPPLLGTGGNDGRLDFSTNFHQRLAGGLGTSAQERRRGRLGRPATCSPAPRPSSSPAPPSASSTPAGAGRPRVVALRRGSSLVNPGVRTARRRSVAVRGERRPAEPARRGPGRRCRSRCPLTGRLGSGAAGEESRGEVWAPVWTRELHTRRRSGSCSPRRERRGTVVPPGAQSTSTPRPGPLAWREGSTSSPAYGLQRRNGLAFTAVPLDRIDVREGPKSGWPPTWRTGSPGATVRSTPLYNGGWPCRRFN